MSRSILVQFTKKLMGTDYAPENTPTKQTITRRFPMFLQNWFRNARSQKTSSNTDKIAQNPSDQTLADIKPGERAQVISFETQLPSSRRAHLIAYGLSPGYWVEVIQQSPVTIVQIDHTELALEKELAKDIIVSN